MRDVIPSSMSTNKNFATKATLNPSLRVTTPRRLVHQMTMLSENSATVSFDDASIIVSEDENGIVILSSAGGGDTLSMPDSVPSEVNSIHFLVPNPILVPGSDEELEEEEEPDLFADVIAVSRMEKSLKERNHVLKHLYGIIFLSTVVFLCATVFLVRDRNLLHERVRELQFQAEFVVQAREESEAHYIKTQELEEQVRRLQKEASSKRFPWEDDNFFIDHGWAYAKAKTDLGQCATKATESAKKQIKVAKKHLAEVSHAAKKHALGLTNAATKAQEAVWEHVQQEFAATKQWFEEEVAGAEVKSKEIKIKDTKPKATGKPTAKAVAKSVLTTAALGTAAALVFGAADTIWDSIKNPHNDD